MKGCKSNRVDGLDLEVAFVVAGHQIVLMHDVGDEAAFTRKCLPDRLAGFVEFVRGGFEAFDGSQVSLQGERDSDSLFDIHGGCAHADFSISDSWVV